MFKFLKKKIQEAVKKFSSSANETESIVETQIVQEDKVIEEIQEELQEQQKEQADESKKDDSVVEAEPESVIEDVPESIKKLAVEEIISKDPIEEPVKELKEHVVEETSVVEEVLEESLSESVKEDLVEETPEIIADTSEPEVIELHSAGVSGTSKIKDDEESIPIPDKITELIEEAEVESTKKFDKDVDDLFSSDDELEKSKDLVVEDEPIIEKQVKDPIVEELVVEGTPVDDIAEDFISEPEAAAELKEIIGEPEDIVAESELEKVEKEKPGFFKRIFGKKEDLIPEPELQEDIVTKLAEDVVDEKIAEPVQETIIEEKSFSKTDLLDDDVEDATKKKKGFFAKIKEKVVKFQLTDEIFEDLFWDFELALLENNVALEVIEKIKSDLREQLTQENVSRRGVDQVILDTLKQSLDEVLTVETFDFIKKLKSKKPFIITMIGVNGSGKTTTLAKIIHLLQQNDLSVVVAASDTFRAAAIQQLEEHTTKLGVKLIKHDYNADPSAVAFDAINHAKAKNIDVVLIDTAGRLQSNSNLMDELKKLIRVNKPDMNIFIGESITGNDCVEQAMAFNEAVGIDGIILSKADIDEKGGAAISVSYVTKKPILYLGTGQTYDDLKPFRKEEILENLGL